ncbi:hypothetical protein N9N26_03300 [Candidatus Poseidoniales archaeon]|nr:hypothetical protein [Candidatus Poseidoniales archaeon]
MVPFASGATTETQFQSGNSSYTQTFMGSGNGTAGDLSIPFGAEVTAAEFKLRGDASRTSYTNFTTNAHFGGSGDGAWSGSPPSPFTSGSRSNVDVTNREMSLKGNPSLVDIDMGRTQQIQSTGSAVQNTTGQFVANGDQGYTGLTKNFPVRSVSTTAGWNHIGVVVQIGDEYHVMRYTSQYLTQGWTILRVNATTGAYLGTASVNTNACSSTGQHYKIVDATVDGSTVYTAHEAYNYLTKWTVTSTSTSMQWKCDRAYSFSPNYVTGVDIDDATGKLWISTYSYSAQTHYLNEVDKTSPTSVNGTWTLGGSSTIPTRYGAGLIVNYPTIIYNEYDQSYKSGVGYNYDSYHHYLRFGGNFIEHMGVLPVSEGGHYGLVEADGGKVSFACAYYSIAYCPTSSRHKIYSHGDGALYDARTPTSTSNMITGAAISISKPISQFEVTSIIGYIPSGTSIEVDLSNDGGATWRNVNSGQTVNFASASTSLLWRATLNGTTTSTPILDGIGVQYTTSYVSSSYMYAYQYIGSGSTTTVAATITWDATTPSGTSVRVNYGYGSSTCSTGASGVISWTTSQSGQTKALSPTGSYMCLRVELSSSNSQNTPTISNISVAQHADAPEESGIEIGGLLDPDRPTEWTTPTCWKHPASDGALMGPITVTHVTSSAGVNNLLKCLNDRIPDTGAGIANLSIGLVSASSGVLSLESFSITYTVNTINLDIQIPAGEVLHERLLPYEIVTRHIIGEDAASMSEATLTLQTNSIAKNPILTWQNGDVFPSPNDPEDYIELDASSWSAENNGILEIHWIFHVTAEFPDQTGVRFKTGCLDNSGSAGYSPLDLLSDETMDVNRSFGLGWLKVRDNDGRLTMDDVPDNSWVAAGETLYFQGAMWFQNTQDAPKDSAFDVRISRNGWVESTARDTTNNNGTFFIGIDLPEIDVPDGLTYEVQTYNERNPTHAMAPNGDWQRTYKVDATAPERINFAPVDDGYEAASVQQEVKILVNDNVGHPMSLELMYWVEADHDANRNGEADPQEYVMKTVHNATEAENKWFITTIDHSRNPNMGRVSYFWKGGDQAGNPLFYSVIGEDSEVLMFESEAGFIQDDATFRTRKDSSAVFTGLEWNGHEDNGAIYAGMEQTITLGFIDANTVIDFEHISLVFDFEGPNPLRDAQRISYSGMNDTFWSESEYIDLLSTSSMHETTNESGLPWIQLTFNFEIGWDWPDEEMGDVALIYKERGSQYEDRILLLEHTFRVENDLMLAPSDYLVEDISEPRTGQVADGSRVRKDDRLAFTGTVVYEGSSVPAPRDVGILVEVFDGEKMWSDGSLTSEGEYSVEVPLSAASTLQSSPTRTCLISITNIPGRGEDMTGTLVSTTLQVIVDDAAPRVVKRTMPMNVIDISANNDLTNVPVEFHGTEDADLTGSKQMVHWVMRDATRTVTIGAGSTLLGMQQENQNVIWTGSVDLTDGGRITPQSGDFVGFYISGYDAAGNQFPVVSNSEASPVPELAANDTDFERQWIRLGAVGAELRIHSIDLSDDHVSPGASVEVNAKVINTGGNTDAPFKVSFFAGDSEKPFDEVTLTGIDSKEVIEVSTIWSAENVERLRVVVDRDNLIIEVNDDDNSAEHSVEMAYPKYLGWFDSPRENPLAWIFIVTSIIVLIGVATIAARTSIDHSDGMFEDDEDWDEDEDGDYEDEEEDDYDED